MRVDMQSVGAVVALIVLLVALAGAVLGYLPILVAVLFIGLAVARLV